MSTSIVSTRIIHNFSSQAQPGFCFNCDVNTPVLHLETMRFAPLCSDCALVICVLNVAEEKNKEKEKMVAITLIKMRRKKFKHDMNRNSGVITGYKRSKEVGLSYGLPWCDRCGCEWAEIMKNAEFTCVKYCEVCMRSKESNC